MKNINEMRDDTIKDLLNLGYVDWALRSFTSEISTFDHRDDRYAIANILYQIYLNDMNESSLRDMYLERLDQLLVKPVVGCPPSGIIAALDEFAMAMYAETAVFPDQENDLLSCCTRLAAEWISMTIRKLIIASVDDPTSLNVCTIPMTSYDKMALYNQIHENS